MLPITQLRLATLAIDFPAEQASERAVQQLVSDRYKHNYSYNYNYTQRRVGGATRCGCLVIET